MNRLSIALGFVLAYPTVSALAADYSQANHVEIVTLDAAFGITKPIFPSVGINRETKELSVGLTDNVPTPTNPNPWQFHHWRAPITSEHVDDNGVRVIVAELIDGPKIVRIMIMDHSEASGPMPADGRRVHVRLETTDGVKQTRSDFRAYGLMLWLTGV